MRIYCNVLLDRVYLKLISSLNDINLTKTSGGGLVGSEIFGCR